MQVATQDEATSRLLRGHLPSLDGVRGVAIVLVMLCHFTFSEPFPIRGLHFALNCLSTGVDLFFVLSGFLITGILLDAKGTTNYYRNFYARRVLRIFPLYYAAVLLFAFFAPNLPLFRAFSGVQDAHVERWWLIAYGANLTPIVTNQFVGWVGHFWSLSVEEHFYLVWPFIVASVPRRTLIKLCLALPVAGLLCRIAFMLAGHHDLAVYIFTPCRMDGLVLGSMIAVLFRGPLDMPALVKHSRRLLPIAGPAVVLVYACNHLGRLQVVTELFASPVAALFFGCFLITGVTFPAGSLGSRILSSGPLRFFGMYSYGIYVFHVPLVTQLWDWRFNVYLREHLRYPLLGSLVFILLCFAASTLIAVASYGLYEKHFLRLKRFFQRSQKPQVIVEAAAKTTQAAMGI